MVGFFTPPPGIIDGAMIYKDHFEPDLANNKNYLRWSVDENTFEEYLPGLKFTAGNVYYHEEPYHVHTDVFTSHIGVNVLIPLERENPQKFIVFDQTYKGSTSWVPGDGSIVQRGKTKVIYRRPYDTPGVMGLTDNPVSDELAENLEQEKDFYYGLTGTLIDWLPGEGIVFPSINLHATGIMEAPKYGLALWFDNTVEEICTAMKK